MRLRSGPQADAGGTTRPSRATPAGRGSRPPILVFANDIVENLPRGRSHLADQLTRAATSIVLNIAEDAGKSSRPDKRRYYLTALGSVTERASICDVCLLLKLITETRCQEGKSILEEVGKMLTTLAKTMEGKGEE